MANERAVLTPDTPEHHQADECCENIPPGGIAAAAAAAAGTSRLKDQVGDIVGYSEPNRENEPLPDICACSTPAPSSSIHEVKANSRLSGLQSALTPILKYLNIGNKCPSPEPLKHGNKPHVTVPPWDDACCNSKKSTGGSSQHSNSQFSTSHSGRSSNDPRAHVSWLADECLPEITLLDVTCDSTMQLTKSDSAPPHSVPPCPQDDTFSAKPTKMSGTVAGSEETTVNKSSPPRVCAAMENHSQINPHESSKYNDRTASKDPNTKMVDIPGSIGAPFRWLDDRCVPEITLLEVTRDSEFSPGGDVSLDVARDIPPVDTLQNNAPTSALDGQVFAAEPVALDMISNEDSSSTLDGNATHVLSSISEQSDKCVGENVAKANLGVTQDISMGSVSENSQPSSELQNNTFDKCPSKQNVTLPVLNTSSSERHHNTLILSATRNPTGNNSEAHPPELSKHNGSTASSDPDGKVVDLSESTLEANPYVGVASADQCKDHSPSGLPVRDRLSNTVGNHSMDIVDVKGITLNLDDTLDLGSNAVLTSTPMTNCKNFNWNSEREKGKIIGAPKELYMDSPNNPVGQVSADIPPRLCDRKAFSRQPAPTSLLPPLKSASQFKHKSASTLPRRSEVMSGLPMTRQRAQAEALRNAAASDAPTMTTRTSASHSLHATTPGSKPPNPGLQKPRMSCIPSGIQRAAPVSNPWTRIFQARKHPLTRGDALSTAKRKRTDDILPSGNSEPSTSSCNAATRAKSLKQPTASQKALPAKTQRAGVAVQASTAETSSCNAVSRVRSLKQSVTSQRTLPPKSQGHGCAKCVMLEQQLEMKSDEIKRLKDLLKYRKQEEES